MKGFGNFSDILWEWFIQRWLQDGQSVSQFFYILNVVLVMAALFSYFLFDFPQSRNRPCEIDVTVLHSFNIFVFDELISYSCSSGFFQFFSYIFSEQLGNLHFHTQSGLMFQTYLMDECLCLMAIMHLFWIFANFW